MDSSKTITSEFKKLTKDFIGDVLNSFPEVHEDFTENELEFLKTDNQSEAKMQHVFDYCLEVYPERFFDILYENEEIFTDDEKNTNFFKNIDFKDIWKLNISENTKKIIWKYLQLTLFSVTNNLDDTTCFKDTAKLFEAIDEQELKSKIEEVISSMSDVFDISGMLNKNKNKSFDEMNDFFKNMMENMDMSNNNIDEKSFEEMMKNFSNKGSPLDFEEMMKNFSNKGSPMNVEEMMKNMDISGLGTNFMDMMKNMEGFKDMEKNMFSDVSNNFKDIPNPEDLQDHLNSLMGGKIGQLAQEIANDTAKDLDIDPENISNVNDVFSKLFKNPGKLMGMIKKVSSKLDEKLKSGELKETELMKEASELVEKMKNTPGMKNMENMLNKMGLGGMGGMGGAKGGKVNMNLFQSMMKQNIKKSSNRDRMLQKLKERKLQKEREQQILLKQMQQRQQNSKVPTDKDSFDEYIQKTFNVDNSVMKKSKINKKKKKKKKRKDKRK
jgi:hypothetical protein